MHIGFLTPEYPEILNSSSGGLGTSIKNLALSLVKMDITVSVFIYNQEVDTSYKEGGIFFYLIKKRTYRFFGWYKYRKYLEKFLNDLIQKEKVDFIEAPDWTGITAFMKLDCPTIIRLNGSDAYFCHLEGRKQKFKNYYFENKGLKSADGILSVSAFTASKTKEIFNLKKEITVIPNNLDINKFSPSNVPIISNRLLYFGTLIRKKGIMELAEIFNKVIIERPDVELWLVGQDALDIFEKRSTFEIFMERLSPKSQSKIKYLREVSYSSIQKYISSSQVVVLPSFAEALPMTWLEAMAMEKALVTSDIGWATEVMIDGKTGFTENPKNHQAFAGKILYLLNNPKEAGRMGKAARKHVASKFSTDVVVQQNISFYKHKMKEQSL